MNLQKLLNLFLIPHPFCLKSYRQIFGISMGSSLSPIIAELVLQNLEQKFQTTTIALPLYFRYVDNILLAAPSKYFNTILQTFNSQSITVHTRN